MHERERQREREREKQQKKKKKISEKRKKKKMENEFFKELIYFLFFIKMLCDIYKMQNNFFKIFFSDHVSI